MPLAEPAPPPWYRPGKSAVLAAAVVAVAFLAAQVAWRPVKGEFGERGGLVSFTSYPHGWPIAGLWRIDTEWIDLNPWSGLPTTWTTSYDWQPLGLLINGFAAVVLLLSAAFVFERWRRSGFQFSIRSLMVLVAVAAVAVFLGQREPAILGTIDRDRSLLSGAISIPLAVGVGCTIFTLIWLAFVPFEVVWQAARGRDPWA